MDEEADNSEPVYLILSGYPDNLDQWSVREAAGWEAAVSAYLTTRSESSHARVVIAQLVPLLITYRPDGPVVRVLGKVSG